MLSAYDLDLTRSSQLVHEPPSLTKELDIVNGFWGRASFYVGVAPARLSMFQRWFLYLEATHNRNLSWWVPKLKRLKPRGREGRWGQTWEGLRKGVHTLCENFKKYL